MSDVDNKARLVGNEIIIQNKNKLFFKTTVASTGNIFICIHAYLCFSFISKALFRCSEITLHYHHHHHLHTTYHHHTDTTSGGGILARSISHNGLHTFFINICISHPTTYKTSVYFYRISKSHLYYHCSLLVFTKL